MRLRAIVLVIALALAALSLADVSSVQPDLTTAAAAVGRPLTPVTSGVSTVPRPTASAPPRASPDTQWPPTRSLLFNDPRHHRHAIARTLVRYIDATPAGASIQVSTYFLGSGRIGDALATAASRGVHVEVLLSRKTRTQYSAGRRLAQALRGIPGSWLHWVAHSTRGISGIDHQKIYRFSRVGSRPDVTVLGSYNSAERSDDQAYSLMLELTRRAVYDALGQVFAQSVHDRVVLPNPLRTYAGRGWSLYVLPSLTPYQDPVLDRLRRIPAGPSTRMRIAMYAMNGWRAGRISHRLEAMARAGATITFAAGPGVQRSLVPALEASGVHVVAGCFADGTYTHSKDMTASWRDHGHRTWWTWVGSDNWTDFSDTSDEATLGLRGKALYDEFGRDFDTLLARAQIPLSRCHPSDQAANG